MKKITTLISCILITLTISACTVQETVQEKPRLEQSTHDFIGEPKIVGYEYPIETSLVSAEEEIDICNTVTKKDKFGKLYPYSYSMFGGHTLEAYETIYNEIYNFNTEIDVAKHEITVEQCDKILTYMLLDNPDFYYVSKIKDYGIINGEATVISIEYRYSKEQVEEWGTRLNKLVTSIKSQLSDDISYYDLYVYLHDFVAMNVDYNDEYETAMNNNMVGALLDKKSTCMGFAHAYLYLCREFDIVTSIKTGEVGASHIWNCVPYNDGWFNVDVCMDNVDGNYNDWSYHNIIGTSDSYMTEKWYVTYEKGDARYYPSPVCEEHILYRTLIPKEHIITSTDFDEITEQIISLRKDDEQFVEVYFDSYDLYLSVADDMFAENQGYADKIKNEWGIGDDDLLACFSDSFCNIGFYIKE